MPTHKPDLTQFSISDLHDITGFAPRTIVKRLEGLDPVAQDGKTIWYAPRVALARLYDYESPLADKSRLDRARAEAQEMKNAEVRGALIPESNIGFVGTGIMSAVKMRVMGLRTLGPAVRAAGSDAEAAEIIEAGAREALTEIAGLGDLARAAARRGRAVTQTARDDLFGSDAATEADDERVGGQRKKAIA
ncbi:MAG: hypothetical protein WA001_05890 [Patescibacteria group bacterium]